MFNKLTALTTLYLNDNALTGLPDDVFEKLTVLSLLDLSDNPGKAGFKPTADAGERQVVERVTVVTLDGSESDGGPRGANFFYSWVKTTGPDLTLTGSDTTMPTFTAPGARDDLVFTLTVTGRGVDNESNPYTDRAEARVKVPTVCDRTDAVADAIVAAVDGVTTCGAVTSAHLQGITTLILEGQSIASLHSGDSRASPRLQRCISTITLWRACRQTS